MYLINKELEKRWSIFPVIHKDLWDMYKNAESQTWVAEEIDLSGDKYDELEPNEKEYLKNLLAFFAVSDGLVLENLATNFLQEVDILEAQYYYGHQTFIEQVHANMYSLLIDTFIKDRAEQSQMFNSITEIETVGKKAKWAMEWINHPSFAHRLVAFACVEGLAFSSTFAGIFWFRSRNKMPGLCEANELIMKDENSHYGFATYLYNNYVKEEFKLNTEDIRKIITDCYEVEKTFVIESMPDGLQGITKKDMLDYVKYVTDTIMIGFDLEAEFGVSNPLDYMTRIALPRKTNFFEKRNTDYTRVEVPKNKEDMFTENF